MTSPSPAKRAAPPEFRHARIRAYHADVADIKPSPENDQLYRPVDPADPEIRALAESIGEHGVLEPLVLTDDFYILSGHRRHAAAKLAGVKVVPIRLAGFRRVDDPDDFVAQLREYNRQREKSLDEKLREEVVSADPEEAYRALIEHRAEQGRVEVETITIRAPKRRAEISRAKADFVAAIKRIVFVDQRNFWPLSDRRIHYALLNDPPLKHASKPDSRYDNTAQSYDSLTELLTRLRLVGEIPFEAVDDETRPIVIWDVHPEHRAFIRKSLDGFLKRYHRDLMRSQPNHVEIVVEKNTVAPLVNSVAGRFCIPVTSGRGFASLPPRWKMAQRFAKSGKGRLVILFATDYDPEGEEIAHSFARSMRDDFGIERIEAIKVAIGAEHVRQFNLPPKMTAKSGSSNRKRFVEAHGEHVWELEAIPPAELQRLFREKIDAVIDVAAFNAELDAEKADAAHLENVRRTVSRALKAMNLDADASEGIDN